MNPPTSQLPTPSNYQQALGTGQVCTCNIPALSRINVPNAQPINDHFGIATDSPERWAQRIIIAFASAPSSAALSTAPAVAATTPMIPTGPAHAWPQHEEDRWVNSDRKTRLANEIGHRMLVPLTLYPQYYLLRVYYNFLGA
ncbi:hypothetical protein M408DRAFT_318959 [Serendipita vermifera MAFF 305830]|uniref:Uncharacterized protein n=1 Tax=Serendipita vermifera MAFF 305830 TaxID=933852 RepID=A0A0C3AY31_SERVB|nr:hypothetical protein M408DRAFT_318959 [Serendipita vermifera MAFF 305830]